jgi:PAS domain S-box-containing protein
MRVGTRIGAVFLVSLMVVGGLAARALIGASNAARTNDWVNRTNEVLKKLDAVYKDLVDIESGSRGYVITGQMSFLRPYLESVERSGNTIAELRGLVADNPKQAELAARLAQYAQRRIAIAARIVDLRRAQGQDAAAKLIATGEGRTAMEAALGLVGSMRREENDALARRMALSQRRAHQAPLFIIASLALLASLSLLSVLWLSRSITRPLAALVKTAQQFGRGEQPAPPELRADEIGDLGREFIEMVRLRREAEERTRALLELAPDAFFQADLDARFTDVNAAACRLLGYSREELVGKTIFEIIPPEDASRLMAVRAALLVPGNVERADWTQKRKDGTLVPVEISANILPDGRWQAFARDISERRRFEDERQVFVSLITNSPDFIGIADPTGKPIYLNPGGRRMVGLADDFPVEQTRIPDYYPSEERQFAIDVIYKSMVERGRFSGEAHLRNWETGEAIPVSDEHFLITDPDSGRVLGMGTILRDISDQRRLAREREELLARERAAREETLAANEQLRESEERFRLTLDEAPIGMALVSPDGRFVRVNRALCELVGYSRGELEQLTFQDITHPDDLDTDLALAVRLVRGETSRYHTEKRYVRRDGGIVTVMVSTAVLRHPGGPPLYYVSQIEDITARKHAEEEQRRLADELRGALQMRDEVLGIVAHDLRNPLSTIIMHASTMVRRAPEAERRNQRAAESISRVAKRMNRLIQDLLDVTQVKAGGLRLQRARVSVEDLVIEAIEMQKGLAASSRVSLWMDLAPDLPAIWADRDRLLQVFENLIGNAIKFTQEGGHITVSALPSEGEVLFFVSDTGSGISKDGLPHVFDPFWQAAEHAGRLGAGLGLPISKGIVEAHGGRIWVESAPGLGTTFFFVIPPWATRPPPVDAS